VISIKISATTAASRKKLVKNVDQIEKMFSPKMIRFQTSQYVKAIEAAEESSQYSEDLKDEWAAKSLAAHVILTFEKMIKSAEMELR
jgi:ribosome recycling factor